MSEHDHGDDPRPDPEGGHDGAHGADRDELAWLVARERGQPLPAVSEATAARHVRLGAELAALPAAPGGLQPRAGWEQQVLAAIDASEAEAGGRPEPTAGVLAPLRAARRRRWAVVAVACAAAAGVVLLLAVRDRGGAPEVVAAAAQSAEVVPGERPHRGPDPSVGDTLHVRGELEGEGQGELRIYDAAGLEQARCAAAGAGCAIERSGARTVLELRWRLRAPGVLRAVLFTAPLGGPSAGLDGDLEAARRRGIAVVARDVADAR